MSNHVHPAPEQLAAFATGQAPEDSAVQISQHLADCEACRTLIDNLPEDTLVSLLRQSPSSDEPTNGHAGVSEALTAVGVPSSEAAGVPEELADHPRYHVLGLLGSGGMGAVYKAEHRRMERLVALKVINASLMNRPDMVERFHREVKAAARLTHPNIVTAHDAGQAGNIHFLVMEFVEGISLAQHVQERGRLAVADACSYIQQAALGLEHAFEQGMVHRDIKPHNLMLTPRGQVKILDFGLARFARETVGAAEAEVQGSATDPAKSGLTQVGVLMGTADFIAPEQASDPRKADIRADIYSLGCTLYYLLSGHAPYPEGTAVDKLISHAERTPQSLSKLRGDVPAELARVLDKIMAKNPKDRYQTPAAVAAALTPFMDKYRPRKRRRARLAVAAGVLAAAVVAAIVIYVQTDRGEFEIWTDDDQVALLINKNGVTIHDQASKRKYELKVGKRSLPSGEYMVSDPSGGIEFSTSKFTITRGGKEKLVAILRYGGLRDDAFRWFPAGATFFGGRDMTAFKELSVQQILVVTQLIEKFNIQERDRFWKLLGILDNGIARVSFAYVQDQKEPARSRIFIRLSGKFSHARLEEFFRTDWPKSVVSEKKGPNGERITIAGSSEPIAPAWAVIGDTDLIAAGYQGLAGKHVEVIEQMLALRAGQGENLTAAKAEMLSELPAGTWAVFAGQPPEVLGNLFLFPVLPRSMRITIGGTQSIQVQFQGNFAGAGDARKFTDNVGSLKELGLGLLKILPIDEKIAGQLADTLKGLKIDPRGDGVSVSFKLPGEAGDGLAGMLRGLPLGMFEKLAAFFPKGKGTAGKDAQPEAVKAGTRAAEAWLKLVNQGQYAQSWEQSSQSNKSGVTKQDLVAIYSGLFGKLGKLDSRALLNRRFTFSLPGAPDGEYVVIQFEATYKNLKVIETVTTVLEKEGQWRVGGFQVAAVSNPAAIQAAVRAAEAWLKLKDQGQYAQCWEQSSAYSKKNIGKQDVVDLQKELFKKMGKLESRAIVSRQFATSLTGGPDGEYVVIQFQARYQKLPDVIETVIPMLDPDGQWRVAGYQFTPGKQPLAGKETTMLKKFGPTDKTISQDVTADQGGWRIDAKKTTTVRLFEIADPGAEDCTVSYRARLKTANVEGKAYLEMWCRFKGKEYFSRGLHNPATGTTDWASHETPFFLKKGERPDLIKLNLVIEGQGTVWIKDVEVLRAAPSDVKDDAGKDGRIKAFGPKDKTLTQDRVVADEGGWRIDARAKEERTVRLFEVPDPGVDDCFVYYRMKIKTDLGGVTYPVMWCRLPGKGEFFSKGLDQKVTGKTDWTTRQIPFRLEKGQRPDLIKLDLVVIGPGQVWVKDVELVRAPLGK